MVVFHLVHPEGASYRCAIRRQSQALIALTQTSQWGLCCGTLCFPRFWQCSRAALDKGLTIRTGEMSFVEPPVR